MPVRFQRSRYSVRFSEKTKLGPACVIKLSSQKILQSFTSIENLKILAHNEFIYFSQYSCSQHNNFTCAKILQPLKIANYSNLSNLHLASPPPPTATFRNTISLSRHFPLSLTHNQDQHTRSRLTHTHLKVYQIPRPLKSLLPLSLTYSPARLYYPRNAASAAAALRRA